MKSPIIAAVLNFVLPGAGLVYLGRFYSAAANFAVAVMTPFAWVTVSESGFDTVPFVTLAIAAGSAGFAHAAAGRTNEAAKHMSLPKQESQDSSAASSA